MTPVLVFDIEGGEAEAFRFLKSGTPIDLARRSLDGRRSAGVLACIVPWTVRNELRLHAFVPISTNTGDNLCIGHADGATGAFAGLPACETEYRFLDGLPAELGSDKAKQRIALRGMADNIDREPWLLWRRTYFMWFRDGDHDGLLAVQSYRQDRWMDLTTEARLLALADWVYWLVGVAGVVGLVQLARRREAESWLLVGSAMVTALACKSVALPSLPHATPKYGPLATLGVPVRSARAASTGLPVTPISSARGMIGGDSMGATRNTRTVPEPATAPGPPSSISWSSLAAAIEVRLMRIDGTMLVRLVVRVELAGFSENSDRFFAVLPR